MSDFLYLLENEVQIVALSFMGIAYIIKLIWLFRFSYQSEKTTSVGNQTASIAYSMMNVAMPHAMESTRKHPLFYLQFVIYHVGVVAGISATFIIPYWPQLFEQVVIVRLFQATVAAAFLVGLFRIFRRIKIPSVRIISSIDDYFALIMINLFFASAFFAMPNRYQDNELPQILFFIITTFFLVYVPFSKICHYLYYPFTRFFLGRIAGHRGVYFKR